MHKHYETVFIITPLLTEDQVKGVAEKYRDFLTSNGAELIHEETGVCVSLHIQSTRNLLVSTT